MIELGLAVLIFTLIAGVATLAIARAQLSAAQDRFERSAETELAAMLAIVATGSYDNLVDGNFLRPEPCPEAAHLSCPSVHGRTLTVSWDIAGVADPTGLSTENLAGVLIAANTTLPFGKELSRERFVDAANAGAEGTTLVRISLDGAPYTGPLYLMTATGVIAGSAIVDDMQALVRSGTASCPDAAPCRLALRPDGTAREDALTLDHLAVAGDGITFDEDTVVETGATIRTVREVHVLLLAENADGRRAWANTPGSVCLYLSVPTPTGTFEEPACNTESPERVIWRTYRPDPVGNPDVRIALPNDVDMSILSDPSETTCNAPGQVGWTAGAWADAAVCTSWTWGGFTELRDGLSGDGAANVTGARLNPGSLNDAHYTALWTAAGGAPASGHTNGALWEKPRDVGACAATASCSAPTGDPDSSCPNGYCNSSRNSAPVLLSPRRGTYQVPAVSITPGELNNITVGVNDTEDDEFNISVRDSVSGLTYNGETVLDGDLLLGDVSGPITLDLGFEPGPGFTSDTLGLTLSDATGTRDIEIVLSAGPAAAFQLITEPVEITQNSSTSLRLLVIDDTGELASGVAFTYSAPDAVSIGVPAETTAGTFTAILATGPAASEETTYTLTAGTAGSASRLLITGRAGTVTVTDASYQQGASGTLTANVTDAVGNQLEGAHAWFELSVGGPGTVPLGVYPRERGCITDASGTCSVALSVEQNATVGTFTSTGRSGGKTGTATLSITASIARIISDGGELEQGSTITLVFVAYNGRREPAVGIAFTASTTGASVTPNGTTGADGTASIDVTADTNTPTGPLTITINDGVNEHTVRVNVLSTVTSVSVPSILTVAQYGNAVAAVTARNGQGAAVPYATLTLTPDNGIFVPGSIVTDDNGTATIALTVGTTTDLGQAGITISYQGTVVGTVQLSVGAGIANLTTASTLQTGATRTVRLTIAGNDGSLIGGRDLLLVPKDTRITVTTPMVRTNLLGYADFTVTCGTLPAGAYDFTVRVDGRVIPVTLQVTS